MSTYSDLISNALDQNDPNTLALVERLMRLETGGCLDHLPRPHFDHLARQAYEDARAWDTIGDVHGVTLAAYCRAEGIEPPAWLRDVPGTLATVGPIRKDQPMTELPDFSEMRYNALRLLGDAEDELRSDWRPGGGPRTTEQGNARIEALQHIARAKAALDRAAR